MTDDHSNDNQRPPIQMTPLVLADNQEMKRRMDQIMPYFRSFLRTLHERIVDANEAGTEPDLSDFAKSYAVWREASQKILIAHYNQFERLQNPPDPEVISPEKEYAEHLMHRNEEEAVDALLGSYDLSPASRQHTQLLRALNDVRMHARAVDPSSITPLTFATKPPTDRGRDDR